MSTTSQIFYDCTCHPDRGQTASAWKADHVDLPDAVWREMPQQEYTKTPPKPPQPKIKRRSANYFSGIETAAYLQGEDRLAVWNALIQNASEVAMADTWGNRPRDISQPQELATLVFWKFKDLGELELDPAEPLDWPKRTTDIISDHGPWLLAAWSYTYKTATRVLADAWREDTRAAEREEGLIAWPEVDMAGEKSEAYEKAARMLGASAEDVAEHQDVDDTDATPQAPPLISDPVPYQPHYDKRQLGVALKAVGIMEDPETWQPKHFFELPLRCGPHRAKDRGIQIHEDAGEALCISLDTSRWWNRFDTLADVTVEDPDHGTIQLEPLDDHLAPLSCADRKWVRNLRRCPMCGGWWVKQDTDPNARTHCYMPCKPR